MRERELIARLGQQFSGSADYLVQGIGDDCAVFGESDSLSWLISSDLVVEDVHFVQGWQHPDKLGRKAIAVNFSDIAAMGGVPRFVLLSLVIPKTISDKWLQSFHNGVHEVLSEFSCSLIGGDVSGGNRFNASVTIVGSAHPDHVVYRSGAASNQDIYVTGYLGSSAAGLEILQKGESQLPRFDPLIEAHLNPIPQLKVAQKLAETGLVSAMQDISDGIASDLSHICKASGVSAEIEREKIPIHPLMKEFAQRSNLSPVELALSGGEDYQLVFVSARKNRDDIQIIAKETEILITRIGKTGKIGEGAPALFLLDSEGKTEISFKGFEHK